MVRPTDRFFLSGTIDKRRGRSSLTQGVTNAVMTTALLFGIARAMPMSGETSRGTDSGNGQMQAIKGQIGSFLEAQAKAQQVERGPSVAVKGPAIVKENAHNGNGVAITQTRGNTPSFHEAHTQPTLARRYHDGTQISDGPDPESDGVASLVAGIERMVATDTTLTVAQKAAMPIVINAVMHGDWITAHQAYLLATSVDATPRLTAQRQQVEPRMIEIKGEQSQADMAALQSTIRGEYGNDMKGLQYFVEQGMQPVLQAARIDPTVAGALVASGRVADALTYVREKIESGTDQESREQFLKDSGISTVAETLVKQVLEKSQKTELTIDEFWSGLKEKAKTISPDTKNTAEKAMKVLLNILGIELTVGALGSAGALAYSKRDELALAFLKGLHKKSNSLLTRQKLLTLFSLLAIASMALSACRGTIDSNPPMGNQLLESGTLAFDIPNPIAGQTIQEYNDTISQRASEFQQIDLTKESLFPQILTLQDLTSPDRVGATAQYPTRVFSREGKFYFKSSELTSMNLGQITNIVSSNERTDDGTLFTITDAGVLVTHTLFDPESGQTKFPTEYISAQVISKAVVENNGKWDENLAAIIAKQQVERENQINQQIDEKVKRYSDQNPDALFDSNTLRQAAVSVTGLHAVYQSMTIEDESRFMKMALGKDGFEGVDNLAITAVYEYAADKNIPFFQAMEETGLSFVWSVCGDSRTSSVKQRLAAIAMNNGMFARGRTALLNNPKLNSDIDRIAKEIGLGESLTSEQRVLIAAEVVADLGTGGIDIEASARNLSKNVFVMTTHGAGDICDPSGCGALTFLKKVREARVAAIAGDTSVINAIRSSTPELLRVIEESHQFTHAPSEAISLANDTAKKIGEARVAYMRQLGMKDADMFVDGIPANGLKAEFQPTVLATIENHASTGVDDVWTLTYASEGIPGATPTAGYRYTGKEGNPVDWVHPSADTDDLLEGLRQIMNDHIATFGPGGKGQNPANIQIILGETPASTGNVAPSRYFLLSNDLRPGAVYPWSHFGQRGAVTNFIGDDLGKLSGGWGEIFSSPELKNAALQWADASPDGFVVFTEKSLDGSKKMIRVLENETFANMLRTGDTYKDFSVAMETAVLIDMTKGVELDAVAQLAKARTIVLSQGETEQIEKAVALIASRESELTLMGVKLSPRATAIVKGGIGVAKFGMTVMDVVSLVLAAQSLDKNIFRDRQNGELGIAREVGPFGVSIYPKQTLWGGDVPGFESGGPPFDFQKDIHEFIVEKGVKEQCDASFLALGANPPLGGFAPFGIALEDMEGTTPQSLSVETALAKSLARQTTDLLTEWNNATVDAGSANLVPSFALKRDAVFKGWLRNSWKNSALSINLMDNNAGFLSILGNQIAPFLGGDPDTKQLAVIIPQMKPEFYNALEMAMNDGSVWDDGFASEERMRKLIQDNLIGYLYAGESGAVLLTKNQKGGWDVVTNNGVQEKGKIVINYPWPWPDGRPETPPTFRQTQAVDIRFLADGTPVLVTTPNPDFANPEQAKKEIPPCFPGVWPALVNEGN